MFKKMIVTTAALALIFTGAAITAEAGSCSSSKSHSHTEKASAKMSQSPTIVETAMGAEQFSTLVTAVKAAGLVDALSSDGPFTVFTQTNEAFAALPEGTLASLLKDTDKLKQVLTYHVLEGKVGSSQVVKIDKAETLNGQEIAIKSSKEGVMINDASVIKTDIAASNGVIHVIDRVIIPDFDAQ